MSVMSQDTVAGLRRTVAELQRQLDERSAELNEALEQQSATAEVLQVINSSPGALALVFEAMLEKALELCGAAFGILWTCDGARIHAAALRGVPPAYAEFLTRAPFAVGPDNALGRLLRGEPFAHVANVVEDRAYRSDDPLRRATVDLGGARTLLGVPLRKDDALLGAFVIYRWEVRPFSDNCVVAEFRGVGGDRDGKRAAHHRDA
jgi:two-component system, NtrC family, sensor kinase